MAYALPLPNPERLTVDEYLRRERAASVKSEFYNHQIVAMAGASPTHNVLASNFLIEAGRLLLDTPCQTYNSDQQLRVFEGGGFFYPDASIACGDAYFDDTDCLRNPLLLVEVLSPSTEHTDRVEKWLHYQQLESLRAYVLITQDQVLVELYERTTPDANWVYRCFSRREDTFVLHCLGITLSVGALYRRVA